ncbi:MAG TPA: sigma-70 family RNA polymerase sigma factor [Candidatus Anammoximicrobium sp.]|nr:sigma-70 family RNA polymerase sigma factor [Candidatus Anammoximicrobium sp.]
MDHVLAPDTQIAGSNVEQLLDDARQGQREPLGLLLQSYRNYLTILATTQLDRRLRRRMSASDLVQETMLAAHRDFGKFRGSSEREFLAWLRQILIHCLHHAVETHVKAQRRDVRCEISLDQLGFSLDRSAANFAQALADPGPSPSTPVRQRERAVALADQLAKLRPEYRDVIVLRNLQGLSFDEIAQRMDRKTGAVRMLWLRAIEKFKQVYEPIDG